MGVNAQMFARSFYRLCQRVLTVGSARARELNFEGSPIWLFSAITVASVLIAPTTTIGAEAQANRMTIEYVPPTNPAHQALYKRLMERRVLEKLQEIFSPFRLPVELKLRTVGCDGVSNAWYQKATPGSSGPPSVNVC